MPQRYVLDASVLVSMVNSDDSQHFSCYSFFRNHDDDGKAHWVVPGFILFEFQATQSRRHRERKPLSQYEVFRHTPLNYENTELYPVTKKFLKKVYELDLYNVFSRLRGGDLLYACIASIEDIPLVTHDQDFDRYSDKLRLINPPNMYGTGNLPMRVGTVSMNDNGKIYSVKYSVFKDLVQLETGQATHIGPGGAKVEAQRLLREIVESGLADRNGLRRVKR
jgi:predicted nucleic acid-binding protein